MRGPMAIAARRHFIRRYVPLVISRGDIYRALRRSIRDLSYRIEDLSLWQSWHLTKTLGRRVVNHLATRRPAGRLRLFLFITR